MNKRIIILILIINLFSSIIKIYAQTNISFESSLPFEYLLKNKYSITIKDNGIIKINNKEFIYDQTSLNNPKQDVYLIELYNTHNILGITINEQTCSGGMMFYTIIINLINNEIIPYKYNNPYSTYWKFFTIEDKIIITSSFVAHAYNAITGELLWTQIFQKIEGTNILFNGDSFMINDKDGHEYRIYKDGIKIKIGESLGFPPILPKPSVMVK